ncbi:FAD-binding oxidoreductase [Micromonospora sp. NPDC005220]|uniref:NAD(P)/FAD-dependent oxidoreductase n=1 Tax=Micromonospora sp. NPDC005220 TaxID=3155589 RepID=UPI0033A55CCE
MGETVTAPARRSRIFWQDGSAEAAGPPLTESVDCDVCIIGGGFTGLWTAYFLRQTDPSLRICVLDSGLAGGAASGTADGFVTPTIGKDLEQIVRGHGRQAAAAACDAVGRSILEIGRFTRRHRVAADYQAKNYLMVATTAVQASRLRRNRDLTASLGARFETTLLDAAQARQRIGSPAIQAAIVTGGATVDPFALARGLLATIRGQGVRVYEQTPARHVDRTADGYRVTTPQARVDAHRVVLATSAFQHRLPGFRRQVLPVWSYAMVSEPLSTEQLDRLVWPRREGLVEAKSFLVCGRLTADNRLLWGGGMARYHLGRDMGAGRVDDRRVFTDLRRSFDRYFPMWHDVRFSHTYGGCVDITRDLVPHFGTAAPGLLYGYGYCGNGIAASHLGGKVLCDLVLGRDTELTRLFFVDGREPAFPPEPLTFLGVRAASRLIEFQERLR